MVQNDIDKIFEQAGVSVEDNNENSK